MPITPPTIAIITSKMHIFLRADFCERKKKSEVQYLHMLLKQYCLNTFKSCLTVSPYLSGTLISSIPVKTLETEKTS